MGLGIIKRLLRGQHLDAHLSDNLLFLNSSNDLSNILDLDTLLIEMFDGNQEFSEEIIRRLSGERREIFSDNKKVLAVVLVTTARFLCLVKRPLPLKSYPPTFNRWVDKEDL